MKPIRTFVILLVLALLLSSVPTTRLHSTRAAELQVDSAPTAHTVEPLNTLNDTDATERLPPSVFSASSVPSVIQSPAGNWHIECVDCPKWFEDMTDHSLRLDGDGHPHIVYGGDRLYYAWYDGTQWHYETVDETPDVGRYASLALDGAGRPHISYSSAYPNVGLKYAWHDGVTWHIETVDSERYAGLDISLVLDITKLQLHPLGGGWYSGPCTSLALDGAGWPHISYCDYTNGDLKYAWRDGSGWQIETVDSGGVGKYASLALDGAGRPHVSYQHGGLKYAWHDGSGWQIKTVDSGGVGEYTSLALDGTGRPHISYHDDTNGDLKYAWYDEATWHIETVDSAEGVGKYTSLALDGADRPHISYYDSTNGDLKYAWYDGTAWHIETMDSGWRTSLALDVADRPHISYYDGYPNYDLKYAWHDGLAWHIETVDSRGWVGKCTSLALDGAGWPHISYYDEANGDLKYAWYDGLAWQIKTVDSDGWVGKDTSLTLDEAGRARIGYYDETNNDLKYAWHDGAAWHIETVDSVGDVGQYTSLALDRAGRPHISYYDYTNKNLKYAWHDGSAWQIETVDSVGWGGYDTSLALDGAGWPHISYHDGNDCNLKYAWHDGTAWQIETVDTVDNDRCAGQYTSLALDGSDRPHISYSCETLYPGGAGDLKYAWHDGTGWQIETVDSVGWLGGHASSLALDRAGRPYISYHYCPVIPIFVVLKYAWYDGTAWHIEALDSTEGSDTSLALDGSGQPRISYYDATSRDLKYAWLMPSPFLDKQAAPSDDLRNNDTLTYTLTLSGPGLSVRLWDPLPPTVHYITDSITGTLTPPAVYSPTVSAVVWQGTLPTDTARVVRFQVTPGITGTGSLSLSLPIVNTAWLTDTYSGFSISSTIIVNGQRVYLPLVVKGR